MVFEDDFSDEASGWTIGAFPTGTIGYRDGQYVIELADVPAATQGSNTVLEGDKRDPKVESLDSVSISATVTKIQQVGGNMGFDHPISRRLDHAEVRPERRLLVTIVDSTVGLCCNSVAFDDIEIRDLS